jgi:hypothetical protein
MRIRLLLLAGLAGLLPGCRALALLGGNETKTIPAEYPYLADRKVVLVVSAPDEALFEHPNVQWEVGDHVRLALETNIKNVKVVDPKQVFDFQRSEHNWEQLDPAELGKRFGAERVIEIDLTQYTTREPESPHLFRGHVTAALRVYNTEYPNSEHTYRGQVQTAWPENGPGAYGVNDRDVRAATLEAFAQDVAGKFYDRTVKAKY